MLRSLLAPLRNIQDHRHEFGTATNEDDVQSRALGTTADESAPASQVKSLVEELKLAEDTYSRITILHSLQSAIGEQQSLALDAFRDADGFLLLMHVLSTLTAAPTALSTPQSTQQVLDCMQLSFMLTSKALDRHQANLTFFEEYVGYGALEDACDPLIQHPVTFEKILGCLLSLSFHEFAVVDLFVTLHASCHDLHELDIRFLQFAPSLDTIHLPQVFKIVWKLVLGHLSTKKSLRLIVYKVLEHLTQSSHRNLAVLSMLGILTPMFSCFISSSTIDQPERQLQRKIIKRLLEMGASTQDAQRLFQCAVKEDKSLDTEMLDLIRTALRSKWPPHISFQDMSVVTMPLRGLTTLPTSGFTFMLWAWFERMPSVEHKIFSISFGSRCVVELSMGSNGALALRISSRREFSVSSETRIETSRWTHIALVYHPHRTSQAAVRIFVDGILSETFDCTCPIHGNSVTQFSLGDERADRAASWYVASAYLFCTPLDDELPRYIHHLGPRYQENFQDRALVRFLTYEASTSLNMHMVGTGLVSGETSLKKAIRDGVLIDETLILCKIVAHKFDSFLPLDVHPRSQKQVTRGFAIIGPLIAIPCRPLDLALWSIGGAQLVLCLVSLAQTSHELSRTIAILCESLRNCWQNSEDMERITGYDVLASILYQKSSLVNMTTFEILFEFFGLNFRSPEVSTITNTIAYTAIALDFELWSTTAPDIQRAHLEHFAFLLRASRYRKFNAKVRLSKLNTVRRLLFAMQSSWYAPGMVLHIVNALGVVMQAQFSANDSIKPVASYIAANASLYCVSVPSPRSSLMGSHSSEKVRLVLDAVISLLRTPTMYMKFAEALPVARIVLLWLGSEPTPDLACQILVIISLSFNTSTSFGKKFELASGWLTLKKVLPPIWDQTIHGAALDLLSQPARDSGNASKTVKCPQMLAVVLLALRQGLLAYSDTQVQGPSRPVVSQILGDLIDLHNSHSSFRQLFKSQSSTDVLVECLWSSPGSGDLNASTQLTQLGLLVARGGHVSPFQKQQILDITKPGSSPASHVGTSFSGRLASGQEDALQRSTARLEEWRNTIVASERERYRKTLIDLHERRRRIAIVSEGVLRGCTERDVWSHIGHERTWRIDETEGPHRTRNKLEPFTDSPDHAHPTETSFNMTTNEERYTEVSSTLQVDGSVKDDVEGHSDDMNGSALEDVIAEDKHRRVRHELEPGDIIEAVNTICRVSGVDSYPGLLIFGRTHLYMLDGLVENDAGELIDAVNAPKGMFFVAGSTPHIRSSQRARRWPLEQIAGFSNKSFLFRDVALEIFYKDSRTLLAVFLDGAHRHDVSRRLQAIVTRHSTQDQVSILGLVLRDMSIALPKGMKRVSPSAEDKALMTAQRQWQNREISNYTYLSILNQLSGRTPSDATQYPVFPWVLRDYTSDVLELSSPESYRDLSKPMGALTPERCEIARNRYENLESVGEKPFHYGTHFSSSMIVCHYLMRAAPYTNMFKTLQGGDWDLPDRLFIDIGRSYLSASHDARGDVRELIPEFFTSPEFLENLSNIDFGCSTSTGEKIHDVKLPPWAKDDTLFFVHMHRQALESRYASENLPAWIDLTWGCKQHDVDSLNVFHPLSYEGAIELDKIADPLEREATVGIIHNFGQTPRKLFTGPHPLRNLQGILSLPVRASRGVPEDALAMTRDPHPLKVLDGPVACIVKDGSGKVAPMPEGLLSPPLRSDDQVQWEKDGNLRVLHRGIVVQTIETTSPSCAAFADQDTLVTGSVDSLVRIWRMSHAPAPATSPFLGSTTVKTHKGPDPSLTLVHLLRKHRAPVISLCVSRAWSLVVSGSLDGSAILWDLNRGLYVRSIWHVEADSSTEDAAVHLVAINESTGHVATCSTHSLWLHTVNARQIARLDLTRLPRVTSIAFHERDYSYLGILSIGHADGSIVLCTWNAEDTPRGVSAQWGFLKVRDLEAEKNPSASITSLNFIGETLWVGYSSGKVVRWFLPE